MTQSYTALAQQVRDAGLQSRTGWFYGLLCGGLLLGLAATATGVILLGHSWLQLLMAAALGVLLTQLAFVGHEASHRQVLTSGPANDRIGWLLATVFVGISYSWWMNKHTRHHGNPNKLGKDPDIEVDTFSFVEEDAARSPRPDGLVHPPPGAVLLPAAAAGRCQPAPEVGRQPVEEPG